MSNSKKKTKKRTITTATSEKEDKKLAKKRFSLNNRAKAKLRDENYPQKREVIGVWGFAKDGKIYDKNMTEKDMRK